jgi:uncharacterized membrane protein
MPYKTNVAHTIGIDTGKNTLHTTGWEAVGRLAAIAVIRTFLNYFLERDLGEVRERQHEGAPPAVGPR